jgi:nucleotide-binding universal stress UspA family protein
VVVGVDGSACAQLALGFAFEQAAARDFPLRVIRTWLPPLSGYTPPDLNEDEITRATQRELDDVVGGWQAKFPDVDVTTDVRTELAAGALVAASRAARLVVVGSRGRGGLRGTLLGSVSQQLIHHSHCPVAVVREVGRPADAGRC